MFIMIWFVKITLLLLPIINQIHREKESAHYESEKEGKKQN